MYNPTMAHEPRKMSNDEVRDAFMERVWAAVRFWQTANATDEERIMGVAFSIMNVLDGTDGDVSFAICPTPHRDHAADRIADGKNYYPSADEDGISCDLASGVDLHDYFYEYAFEKGYATPGPFYKRRA